MGTSTAKSKKVVRKVDPPKTPEQLLREQQEREAAARHRAWQEQLKEKIIEAMTHLDDRNQFVIGLLNDEMAEGAEDIITKAVFNLPEENEFIVTLIKDKQVIIDAITNLSDPGKFVTRMLTDQDVDLDDVDKNNLIDHFGWKDEDDYDGYLPMPGNLADAAKLRDFIESQNWIEQEVPAMLSFL